MKNFLISILLLGALIPHLVFSQALPPEDPVGPPAPEAAKTGEELLKDDPRGGWEKTLDTVPEEAGKPADCTVKEVTINPATGSPDGGGGLFVPVHEVGQLLTLATDDNKKLAAINGLLKESRAIQQELCVHLKAIRRIQYRIEEKEFVDDANSRKASLNATVNSVKAVVAEGGQLSESRAQSPASVGTPATAAAKAAPGTPAANSEQKTPGYVVNQDQNMVGEIKNDRAAFKDTYTQNSGNIFKEEVVGALDIVDEDNPFLSSVSKEDFDGFVKSADNPLPASDWWSRFQQLAEPNNNRRGSFLLANEAKVVKENMADKKSSDEYIASAGFLGSRECAQWSSDKKSCLVWKTISPGSIVQNYVSALMTSALRQVEQADEGVEDVTIGQLAAIQQNGLFDLRKAGQNSITDKPDPCPPNSGSQPGSPCLNSPAWGQPDGSTPPEDNTDPTPPGGGSNPTDDGHPSTPDDPLPGDNNPPGNNPPSGGNNPGGNPNPPGDNNPGGDTDPGGNPAPNGNPQDGNSDGDYNDDSDDADGDGTVNADEPQVWLAANTASARDNTVITWASRNADVCQADNAWLSRGTTSDSMMVLKENGDALEKNSGTTPIAALHPINLGFQFYQNGTDITSNNVVFSTALNGLIQTATVTPPGPIISPADVFIMTFKTASRQLIATTIQATGASGTKAGVVTGLNSGIIVSGRLNPIIATTITTNPSGFGQLGLRPVPTYKIKCTKVINGRVNVATAEKTLR